MSTEPMPVVEVPDADELIDRALHELVMDDMPDDPESEDYVTRVSEWKSDVTRMHDQVYAPLISALADETREALARLREAMVARNNLTGRLADATTELQSTQDELAKLQLRFRGLGMDLDGTQRQVDRQHETIRGLLERVRELGGTVDDVTMPAGPAPVAAEAGR
ncbi:hypothetical protein [Lentzea sp. NPDC059081]|uniref:hypothetical protein n=1 Tax=Lentzea sp. NPDC059081 TaxID=3346719 RepID=UPI0036CBD4E8